VTRLAASARAATPKPGSKEAALADDPPCPPDVSVRLGLPAPGDLALPPALARAVVTARLSSLLTGAHPAGSPPQPHLPPGVAEWAARAIDAGVLPAIGVGADDAAAARAVGAWLAGAGATAAPEVADPSLEPAPAGPPLSDALAVLSLPAPPPTPGLVAALLESVTDGSGAPPLLAAPAASASIAVGALASALSLSTADAPSLAVAGLALSLEAGGALGAAGCGGGLAHPERSPALGAAALSSAGEAGAARAAASVAGVVAGSGLCGKALPRRRVAARDAGATESDDDVWAWRGAGTCPALGAWAEAAEACHRAVRPALGGGGYGALAAPLGGGLSSASRARGGGGLGAAARDAARGAALRASAVAAVLANAAAPDADPGGRAAACAVAAKSAADAAAAATSADVSTITTSASSPLSHATAAAAAVDVVARAAAAELAIGCAALELIALVPATTVDNADDPADDSNADAPAAADSPADAADPDEAKAAAARAKAAAKKAAKKAAKGKGGGKGGHGGAPPPPGPGSAAVAAAVASAVAATATGSPIPSFPLLLPFACSPGARHVANAARAAAEAGAPKAAPKVAKGARDGTPRAVLLRDKAFRRLERVFLRCGAVPIDTPVFELRSTLTGCYGEDSKLIYHLEDQGGEALSLRYDLTVPFARYVAVHGIQQLKRFHIAKVYRRDNPQLARGRFREFYQCDFDVAGHGGALAGPAADAECLSVLQSCLDALAPLGLPSFRVKLSHRRLLTALTECAGIPKPLFAAACAAVDKLDKEPWAAVRRELVSDKGVPPEAADKLGRYVVYCAGLGGGSGGSDATADATEPAAVAGVRERFPEVAAHPDGALALSELAALGGHLEALGCADRVWLDLSLARGLDYYTGVIFEAVLVEVRATGQGAGDGADGAASVSVGSVAAGGRYDGLVGRFSGQDVPAVGLSVGVERLLGILERARDAREAEALAAAQAARLALESGPGGDCSSNGKDGNAKAPPPPTQVVREAETQVLVASAGKGLHRERMRLAALLRRSDIAAEFGYSPAPSLPEQLGLALRTGVPLVAIVGRDEVARGVVRIKTLATGEEAEVAMVDLAVECRTRLDALAAAAGEDA